MQIDHDNHKPEGYTRNQLGFLYAFAFILAGLIFGCLWYLIKGINEDFGMGVVVGGVIGIGLVFLASRDAREAP